MRKKLVRWQRLLGLSEWRIILRLEKGEELKGGEYGTVAYGSGRRDAENRVATQGPNPERTLLHELLHLRLLAVTQHAEALLPEDCPACKNLLRIAEEQTITALSRAFLEVSCS